MEQLHNKFLSDLRANPNNFSFWFPKIQKHFAVPQSVIIPLDDDTVTSLFLEREGDRQRLETFVRDKVLPAIPENWKKIFVKNGCFSDKFCFSECNPEKSVESILASLIRINEGSFCMDTFGNTEFIIREYIEDDSPLSGHKIYYGMPLRPEIRVFYDFDKRKVLYSANYWDWEYCHDSICRNPEDAKEYEAAYPTIKSIYDACHLEVEDLVASRMKNVEGLKNIWSVDMMYAQNKWWLIDMAIGQMSAYWDPKMIEKIKNIK